MKTVCLLLSFFLAVSVCAYATPQDASVAIETQQLESELLLAKKPDLYFIFNLKDKVISFKSRGIPLREIKVEDVKFWGVSVDAASHQLVSKFAFNQPKRDNIEPEKINEEDTSAPVAPTPAPAGATPGAFDIKALELSDMPTNYRLVFHENIQLSVRAKTSDFKTRMFNTAGYAGWYISRPILTLWNSYKGRPPFTSIYLELNEEDARALYWSIIEKSENLFYNP